jgi:hypothetical protein
MSIAAGLLIVLALAGCAGSTNAQTSSSLVRARPTTPPETYVLQFDGAVQSLAAALDRLAALFAAPHYLADTWKADAVNQATLVELGYRQVEGLTPPLPEQDQHASVVAAIQECQTLTVYVFQGINNLDRGPFDEAKKRVDFCRNKLRLATNAPGSLDEQSQPASVEPAQQEVRVTVKRGANLRGGPGTNYPVVGGAREGDEFTVTGRTEKSDWLQIAGPRGNRVWIAAFLVEAPGDLGKVPVVAPPVAPTPPAANAVVAPPPASP